MIIKTIILTLTLTTMAKGQNATCRQWQQIGKEKEFFSGSKCGLTFFVNRRTFVCRSNSTLLRTQRKILPLSSEKNLTCNDDVDFGECDGDCVSKDANVSFSCWSSSIRVNCTFLYKNKNCHKTSWGPWRKFLPALVSPQRQSMSGSALIVNGR